MNRDLIIELYSLGLIVSDDEDLEKKVFISEYDSLTQECCFRRIIRELGFIIIFTHIYKDSDNNVYEKNFYTNMTLQDGEIIQDIYDEYLNSEQIEYFIDSQDEPQDDNN